MTSETLRLAFITELLVSGGTEKQVVLTLRALRETGVDVRVYCLALSPHFERLLNEAKIKYEETPKRRGIILRLLKLTHRLWGFSPHVVQSTHSFSNLYAALPAKVLRAISVGSLRCELGFAKRGNGRWQKQLLRAPDAVILNSMTMVQQCVGAYSLPAKRVYCLPNAVDAGKFDIPARRSHTERVTVIFAGRLIASKRLDVFVKAMAIAVENVPGIRGLVVGSGPEERPMIELARQLGLHEVEFLGERHDIPSLLACADMLVSCSESEGCPNVILEAMASRLPVITTPAGDSELLVEDGLNGYVIPFGEHQVLAERLAQLAGDPGMRQRMGQAGRQRVNQWHHLDGLAHRLLSIYSQIAEDRHIGSSRMMIQEALAGASPAGERGSYLGT